MILHNNLRLLAFRVSQVGQGGQHSSSQVSFVHGFVCTFQYFDEERIKCQFVTRNTIGYPTWKSTYEILGLDDTEVKYLNHSSPVKMLGLKRPWWSLVRVVVVTSQKSLDWNTIGKRNNRWRQGRFGIRVSVESESGCNLASVSSLPDSLKQRFSFLLKHLSCRARPR